MKPIRLILFLLSTFLLTHTATYAYVIAPQPTYETSSTSKHNAKALKKQAKKEWRAKKRAERRARFLAWIMKKAQDEQVVAILLALFVGWLGIHRLYLGSDPIILLWYFITFGGLFGIIPLIDLIRLIIGQTDHYRGNSNLFRAFQST